MHLNDWPVPFLFLVALGGSIVVFCSYLSSFLVGWHTLAKRFTAQSDPTGEVHSAGPHFYSVYWRYWTHYGGIVRLTAAADALLLSVLFLFRIGHETLRIPWNEITFSRTKFFWKNYVVLILGNEEKIPMRISERMARNLGILDRVPA